jgi:thiamine pyrophosphate-dependent acetolactate synthase large subunit-like protein
MPLERLLALLTTYFGDRLTIVAHGPINIDNYEGLPADRYFGISSKASMQGWGLPAGIGIQIARPHERVVIVVGDGGFMFTSGALYTAARLKVPVTVIVANNQGWGSGGYNFRIRGGDDGDLFVGGFTDPKMNLAQLADGLGVRSFRIDDTSQCEPALREVVAEDLPTLIEVVVPPETMRRSQPVNPSRTRGMSG